MTTADSEGAAVLLEERDAGHVVDLVRELIGAEQLARLDEVVDPALAGSEEAVRDYVRGVQRVAEAIAGAASAAALADLLVDEAATVPFTPWAASFSPGEAAALYFTDRVRALRGRPGLDAPGPPPELDAAAVDRFRRRVHHALDDPHDADALKRLMTLFRLSKTELGELFGVSRQAVDQWLARGVPADRQEKLATVCAIADLLERKLKPDRIPGIARRPADAYGGKTMLGLIAEDRQDELLGLVRASFDWSAAT